MQFLEAVIATCSLSLNTQADIFIALKTKPQPLSADDAKKRRAAHSELMKILDLQRTLSLNVVDGATSPDGGKPRLPAINLKLFAAEADFAGQSGMRNLDKVKTALEEPPATDTSAKPIVPANPPDERERTLLQTGAQTLEEMPAPNPQAKSKSLAGAGGLYLAANDTAGAERVGANLTKLAPGDAAGPALLARAALSRDKPEEAAQWARKALALDPANRDATAALGLAQNILSKSRLKGPAAGPAFEGGAAAEGGPGAGSAKAGDLARLAAPPPSTALPFVTPEAAPLSAPPHLSLARRKAAVGDLAGALADLTLALDQNPDDDGARLLRAEISLEMKNPEAALADAEKILARRPEDPRALRAKASALLQLGRLDEALAVIDRALALDPLSGAAHLTRAMILEKLGRALDAAAAFREAARLEPSLTPVAEEAMRRLGFAPSAPAAGPVQRRLLRGGLIVVSLALVLAGLIGGAAKLRTMRAAAAVPAREEARVLDAGSVVGGQYTIKRELGRGGMGVVFEALDETLKRSVALKQLQADLMTDEDAARFLQEARLVAQLKHPNIAEIHAAVDDGGLFLVFELVDGQPLDSVLAQGGALAPEEVRRVVGDLCAGLGCAHGRRIIHRDLKPSNVMLAQDGRSKIMDFGIAHQARGAAATQTAMSGTPPYMAPEQAMGTVLPASDLYALGVMAYELLTGTRPFLGPDFLGPKMRGEFNPVTRLRPGLPSSLDAFFSAALSPDPARRPGDAASFHKAFDACWS